VAGEGTICWAKLVADALEDPQKISALFEALDPVLRALARRVSSALLDDVLQAARVAVWQALPKVDLDRRGSIRAMLLKTAYHAMRDEIRREARQSRLPIEHLTSRPLHHTDYHPEQFGGILDHYAEYVRSHGTFAGAHRHMARMRGVSIAKATSDFHKAAREYIEREGLRPRRKQYAETVEMILKMTASRPLEAGFSRQTAASGLPRRSAARC